jgi:hypothetical protein
VATRWATVGRQAGAQGRRQQAAERPAEPRQQREAAAVGQREAQQPSERAFAERARRPRLDKFAAEVEQPAVGDAGRAGGLAVAAGQAAVEVKPGPGRHGLSLEQLLDQVDTTARAVEFVAEKLVGRAGGEAETAVDTVAQDALDRLHGGVGTELGGDLGLHYGRLRTRRRVAPD